MAVSATFTVGGLSSHVEDNFKDRFHLRPNPFEEEVVDAKQGTIEFFQIPNQDQGTVQAKEDQAKKALITMMHSLLSYSNPELSLVLDGMFLRVCKMSYG